MVIARELDKEGEQDRSVGYDLYKVTLAINKNLISTHRIPFIECGSVVLVIISQLFRLGKVLICSYSIKTLSFLWSYFESKCNVQL